MKICRIFLLATLAFLLSEASAQRASFLSRYINRLVNDTSDIARPQFMIYPTIAYSPETSWELGLSSLYVYYAKNDTLNRLSELSGFAFYTLEQQYGLMIDHAQYTNKDKWFILGRLRLQSFPLRYHGIGPDSPEEYIALVEATQIQVKERVQRQLWPNLYLGIQLDYQRLGSVRFNAPDNEPILEPVGSQGSANLGVGLGIVYDTRHNVLNVRHGLFSELALIQYNGYWLSDYDFSTILSDNRLYRSVGRNKVLAGQVLGQFNMGNVPFNQLAMLGGESIMRGYYLGRFRDKHQLAAQVEYRLLPLPLTFSKRIGAAVFAGVGTVFSDLEHINPRNLKLAAGGGVRYLLFPKKDIYARLDIAFTREGPGFYIFIGEAF